MMKRRVKLPKYVTFSGTHGCVACWRCVEACPGEVFGKVRVLWHKHVKIVNPDACVGCGKCERVCPQKLFILNRGEV